DRWLFERGLARVDRVVTQNAGQQRDCRTHYGRDALVIPSCYIPGARPAHLPPGDKVLWVGTIHNYKRPEMFAEIAKRLPHRSFVLVGGSPMPDERLPDQYFEAVRKACAALPNVEFTGFLPLAQVEQQFDRARVLVNTSEYEGMPNTFLQAWARGVPALATVDVGARLRDEAIYQKTDTVAEAAAEIERLFADELHFARASSRCREYFETSHSSSEVLARYERLFDGLMHELMQRGVGGSS